MKVIIFLCFIALARAGIVAIDDGPVTPYFKPAKSYQPYYDSVLTTHESKAKALDGSEHSTFTKSLDTPYGSVKKFEYRTSNDGYLGYPTVYSTPSPLTVLAQPNYISTPLVTNNVDTVSSGYHASTAPVIAKTVSSPAVSYRAPVITKTINPIVQSQPSVKVAYSPASLVSHMSFSGLGTSYSW